MEIWHVRNDTHNVSRAFVTAPKSKCKMIYLLFRGYKPFNHLFWSKSSNGLKQVLKY